MEKKYFSLFTIVLFFIKKSFTDFNNRLHIDRVYCHTFHAHQHLRVNLTHYWVQLHIQHSLGNKKTEPREESPFLESPTINKCFKSNKSISTLTFGFLKFKLQNCLHSKTLLGLAWKKNNLVTAKLKKRCVINFRFWDPPPSHPFQHFDFFYIFKMIYYMYLTFLSVCFW